MTVQTNTNVASFNGNGVTQIFPIAFKFNNDTDLIVMLADDATGLSSLLTLNSDYTVSGEGDEEGGLINVVVAPAVGKRLFVSRVVDILQMTDLRNQGKFFAEVHEDAFDLLTMIAQQHQSDIARSLRVAETDPEPARIPSAVQRAGKLLAFDSAGNPTTALPVADSSTELRQELAADAGAGKVGWLRSPLADAISSVAQMLNSQHVNVWEFVSGVVSESFDWTAAFQAAIDYMASAGGGFVYMPPRSTKYRITPQADGAAIKMKAGVFLIGAGAASTLELVTAADEQPNTSVNWDAVLFSGSAVVNAGIERVRIAHSGGARNNCASIAVRGGASHIRVMHNIVENSIGSGVVVEGSVASPYPTNCKIHYNRISGCRRHGTYLSGATHNDVRFNFYQNTQLETFAVRNASDNDIERNDVFGDGASYPLGGVALAAPPTGIYVNSRVNVRHNRFVNLPNHALYGQGVGATLRDSDWSDNTIEAMRAAATTSHAVMIYRASGCKFNRNKVYGGRNRGMMFYGCSDNEIVGNLISDTNDAGASVGTLFLASYTDSADSTTTHSQRNRIDGNSILDNRATAKHYYGVQILADNTGNVIGRNRIAGLASGGAEYSAPDWSAQVVGVNVEDFSFRYDALAPGSTASVAAKALGNMTAISIAEAGSLRSLSLYTGQIVTGGTITVTIYLNGVTVGAVTLTGNGSARRAAQYLAPGARKVVPGDVLTAFVSASSMTTGAASVDLGIRVTTSQ